MVTVPVFHNLVALEIITTILLFGIIFFGMLPQDLLYGDILWWRKKREADQLARKTFGDEVARIEALPKLNTRWLLRVPDKMGMGYSAYRSYGTRYNRILVIDELGGRWVGLITPELIQDLLAGEYIWQNYHIPFRGAGEAYAGKPVTINSQVIDIYPLWMEEGLNASDWIFWARIENNFDCCSRVWNYQSGLNELNKHMKEFSKKRAEYNYLVSLAKISIIKK